MTFARFLPRADYMRLTIAVSDLVDACGGQQRAASITRVGQQQISKYASRQEAHEAVFATLDVVADLEADAGIPHVTRVLAQLAGYRLKSLDRARDNADVRQLERRALKEFGEALLALNAASEDSELTPTERDHLVKEFRDVLDAIHALVDHIDTETTDD